jgi:peptidoglycan/LPS O-acetylase OafA/YrhL
MKKPGEYYYPIDLVRFLAAFVVVMFHLGWSTWISPHSLAAPLVNGAYRIPEMESFAWWGAVGVPVFFVISGFVIPGSANGATPMSFLRSRLERLYPAIWICAPVSATIWLLSGAMTDAELVNRFARSLALSPMGPWIDGPYWTLPCEIFFYFLIFCLLLFGALRRLELFAQALTVYSITFNLIYLANSLGVRGLGWVNIFAEGTLKPLLPYYGVFFALGVFIWLDRNRLLSGAGKVTALAAFAVGAIQVGEWATHSLGHSWPIPTTAWLLSCLVIRYATWTPGPRIASFVRMLGLTTYPLYLIHFSLGVWIIRSLVQAHISPLSALASAVSIVVVVSFALANNLEPVIKRAMRRPLKTVDAALQNAGWASFLYRQSFRLDPGAMPPPPAAPARMVLENTP